MIEKWGAMGDREQTGEMGDRGSRDELGEIGEIENRRAIETEI